jgi:hypothetical protein
MHVGSGPNIPPVVTPVYCRKCRKVENNMLRVNGNSSCSKILGIAQIFMYLQNRVSDRYWSGGICIPFSHELNHSISYFLELKWTEYFAH